MSYENSPDTWVDHDGNVLKVPTIKGRLKAGRIPLHAALRRFVFARDGHKCVQCGRADKLVPDHIQSRRNGGSHHPSNLQTLCESCNARKVGLIDAKWGRN
jgi:5-methylcytosine-specific restriction endonuclease McrA